MTASIDFYSDSDKTTALALMSDAFVYSDYHDCYLLRENAVYSEIDGEWYHDDCGGMECCDHCNDHFHRDRNDYVRTDDAVFCGLCCASNAGWFCHENGEWHDYPENRLGEYHGESRDIRRVTPEAPFRIGFEVEKEDADCRNDLENGDNLPNGWLAESDSSLNADTGFELVSPAYNLADDSIESDFDRLSGYLNADAGLCCGGHITISERNTSGCELADKIRGLFPLLMCLYPRRLKSGFVKCGNFSKIRESDEKYRPFAIDSCKIELRIISRVTSTDCLKWRYRLIRYMLENKMSLYETRDSLEFGGWLYNHFAKVYTVEQIQQKQVLFNQFSSYFYELNSTNIDSISEYVSAEMV